MLRVLAIVLLASSGLTDETDMRLVHEFRRRGLFSLAEHSCEQQLVRGANEKQKTRWTILLSDTLLDHAWNSTVADRNPLAVESFRILRTAMQAPDLSEPDRLRLNVQFLESVVRVRQFPGTAAVAMVPGAGNVFDGEAAQVIRKDVTLRQRLNDRIAICEELVADRNMPIAAYERRVLRDRLRLAAALLEAADVQDTLSNAGVIPSLIGASTAEPSATLLQTVDSAITRLDSAARSSADDSIQLAARFEIARLNRLAGRLSEADALQRSLEGEFPQVRLRSIAERIRIALHQDEPTLANQLINECLPASPDQATSSGSNRSDAPTTFASQEIAVLKLEQLTSMLSIAVDLNDAELADSSIAEFETTRPRVLAATGGIWRDRAVAVTDQFRLVQSVGATAAAQMQRAMVAERRGDSETAGHAIREAIEQMPSTAPVSQQLSIRVAAARSAAQGMNWQQAAHWLTDAVALAESKSRSFDTDPNEQQQCLAAERDARILLAWVRGQIYRETSDSAQREQYEQSLRECLERFETSPETERVRLWLATLIAATQPAQSLELLAEEFRDAVVAAEARQLTAGILLHAVTGSDAGQQVEQTVLRTQVREFLASDRLHSAESEGHDDQLPLVVQGRKVAEAELRAFAAENDEDWQRLLDLANDIRAAHPVLAIDAKENDAETTALRYRLNAATLKALCATQRSNESLAMSARIAARATAAERLRLARALSLGIPAPGSEPRSGENTGLGAAVLSANVIEELLKAELTGTNPAAQTSDSAFGIIAEILLRILTVKNLEYSGEQFLEAVTVRKLSPDRQRQLADVLDPEHARHPLQYRLGQHLWKSLLRNARQGSNDWLEASLSLAEWYSAADDTNRATKILTTVELLYPDWGGSERLERASRLRESLGLN